METPKTMDASDVASGSIYLTVQSVFTNLIGVFGITYLARAITQEQMGMLTAITLVNSFVQVLSDFGLTTSLPKFISELRGKEKDASAHIMAAAIFKVPVTFLPCLLLFVFSGEVSNTLFGATNRSDLVRLAVIDSFILGLTPIFNSTLLGSGLMKRIAFIGVFSTTVRWLTIVLLLWSGYGFYGTVIGWIIGDLTLITLYAIASAKLLRRKETLFHQSIRLIPSILKFSWPLFAAVIVSFLYGWYDRAIILAFLPLTDLGIYDVCLKAFTVLATIATALGSALYPFYGMAYGKNDQQTITSGIKKATKYLAIIVFPLALGLLSTANPVITLFAGQQYQSGWSILAILAVFGLVYGLLPAFTGLLVIYEKTLTVLLLSLAPVILSLVFLPLLGVLGLNGLAVMRGASLLFTLILTVYFLSKVVKVEIDKQTVYKTLFASAIMATAIYVAQQIRYSSTLFPVYVLMGGLVYFTCLRFLKVFDKSDVQLMKQTIGEKITIF
ncbi:oligosaccharide flippase family protein, partial [Candidatus Bathyarchaeota archaeon]|nr:oligosaccharide flippase family protein [Candidatus Bathyarchaeota archaeon]